MELKKIWVIAILLLTVNSWADDNVAKEDTTPPPAEVALSVNQIPPLLSSKKAPINSNTVSKNIQPTTQVPSKIIMGQ